MEFLRYPHVIRQLFNGGRFGPPFGFTRTSSCTWIGHPVSLSLPSRGSFHRSFTVLVLYRSSGSILAWRVVPPSSVWIPRVRTYSGFRPILSLSPTGFSPSLIGLPMPFGSAIVSFCVPYPGCVSAPGLAFLRFRSPLLTQSRLITLPAPT